jgi:hypothetical protein
MSKANIIRYPFDLASNEKPYMRKLFSDMYDFFNDNDIEIERGQAESLAFIVEERVISMFSTLARNWYEKLVFLKTLQMSLTPEEIQKMSIDIKVDGVEYLSVCPKSCRPIMVPSTNPQKWLIYFRELK